MNIPSKSNEKLNYQKKERGCAYKLTSLFLIYLHFVIKVKKWNLKKIIKITQ